LPQILLQALLVGVLLLLLLLSSLPVLPVRNCLHTAAQLLLLKLCCLVGQHRRCKHNQRKQQSCTAGCRAAQALHVVDVLDDTVAKLAPVLAAGAPTLPAARKLCFCWLAAAALPSG
jgi:hypothetical protein